MKITKKDIPAFTGRDDWTAAVAFGAYFVRVKIMRDDAMGEPWKEHDGHGPVSEWRSMESKQPGERVLHQDGQSARFYDFAVAVKLARKDGWGSAGDEGLSKGAKAARAVERDFDYLRRWCADDWCWLVIGVEVSRDGSVLDTDYCGGIESDGDYWREHAAEVAQYMIEQDIKKRKDTATAARKETRERRYWEARDVQTKGTK